MKKTFNLILPPMLCLLVGFLASQIQSDALRDWYPSLAKPSLTPPNVVFPIAWTILYVIMGLSFGLIINSQSNKKPILSVLFISQLIVNFSWSIVFFYLRCPGGGVLLIILLEILLIIYAVKAWSARHLSSILFWPYILWVGFAGYLNIYIFLYN